MRIAALTCIACISLLLVSSAYAAEHKISIPKGATSTVCATFHNCYSPEKITISTGDTITWTNDDIDIHTVTSGRPGQQSELFDSGIIKPKEPWSFTFANPDTIDYFCTLHPWMIGQITVIGKPMVVESHVIPEWVKNNAKWWADGTITDADFVGGLQFLMRQGIVKVPHGEQATNQTAVIPEWVKNNAKWWADGTISDRDFVSAIQFLITNGIIKV